MSSFQEPPPPPPETKKSGAPCAKGCGFFGSADAMNMCSVCFINDSLRAVSIGDDQVAPKQEEEEAVVEEEEAPAAAPTPAEIRKMEAEEWAARVKKAAENPYYANRCTRCLKKMRIAERFTCRCGKNYCARHRLSEDHACAFDHQRAGRIAIIRSNPIFETEKLRDRI